MRILELFSGYGTASFALKQLGISYECVGYSDIDKYANQCFRQNHCETFGRTKDGIGINRELGDVTKINPNDLEDFDLLTGGFPCQSFSVAGKGLGELDTRGTLFNEIIRIAEVKQPRYMMLENVKGLMSKKHKPTFDKIISELYRIGYFVKWNILNTKEHGIPQNRERVFFLCFKNWNDFCDFEWPKKEELKLFLKDILEENVDEKYYLKQEQLDKVLASTFASRRALYQADKDVCSCLTARDYKEPKIVQLNNPTHSSDRVYSENGISPTLQATMGLGGGNQPFIAASRGRNIDNPSDRTIGNKVEQRLEPKLDGTSNTISTVQKDNYVVQPMILQRPHGDNKGGYRALDGVCPTITSGASWEHNNYLQYDLNGKGHNSQDQRAYYPNGVHGTLPSSGGGSKCKVLLSNRPITIRKLTPTECFRLQGFLNDEVNLDGLSNTQRYKLAGNGQSVNVVKKIFSSLNLNKTKEEKNGRRTM